MVRYSTFTYLGSDPPTVVDSGRSINNTFQNNTIINGGSESIKVKEADGTQFIGNTFENVTALIRFDDSTATLMLGNTGLDGAKLKVRHGACFDENSDADYTPACV